MPIAELHLKNVCQHREFRRTIDPGLTLIVGRNGTGKSVLLNSMRACITGDWSVFAGVKGDNVYEHIKPREPSFARLRYVRGEDELTITRGLVGGGDSVSLNGGKPETGTKRVNEVVAEFLGLPLDVIARYVFVEQLKMAGFMNEKPADRAESLQVLFGTAHVGKIYDALGDELSRAPDVGMTDEAQSLTDRLAELSRESKECADELATIPAVSAEKAEAARAIVAAVERRKELVRRRINVNRTLREQLDAREQLLLQRLQLDDDRKLYQEACDAGRADVESAKEQQWRWAAYKKQLAQRAALENQRARLRREIAAIEEPPPAPADAEDKRAEDDAKEQAAKAEADVLRQMLAAYDRTGCLTCPTCGTELADEARLADARERLPALEFELAGYYATRTVVAAWEARRRKIEQQRESLEAQLGGVVMALGAIEVDPEPDRSEAEIAAVIADQVEFEDQLRRVLARMAQLQAQADQANGACSQLLHQSGEIEEATEAPRPDRRAYAVARDSAALFHEAAAKRSAAEARKYEIDRQMSLIVQRLAVVQRRLLEAEADLAWRDRVQIIRPYFHRDGLARRVSQSRLAELQQDVNEMLASFRSRFTVEATEDLSFVAHYADGRRQKAMRLSPGEKVVLALAFRVAVNSMFAREIGMLAMDEPTDSLDSENISCVETAMERLRTVSQSHGLQCLVVTHERRLARYCDDVIDLGGW